VLDIITEAPSADGRPADEKVEGARVLPALLPQFAEEMLGSLFIG